MKFAAFEKLATLGALMDRLSAENRDARRPAATPGEVEMVEVAPDTFAPAPAQRSRRTMTHPLGSAFNQLKKAVK